MDIKIVQEYQKCFQYGMESFYIQQNKSCVMRKNMESATSHHLDPYKMLNELKCRGKIQLLPSKKKYVSKTDCRTPWKTSSISHEKQYESIKKSGLLNINRRLTFLKFNYRFSDERDISYPEAFKIINASQKPQMMSDQVRIRKLQFKKQLQTLCSKVVEEVKENSFEANKNWLKDYHENDGIEDLPYPKKKQMMIGTMNVNDLWGEKQLQQSLGFLPWKRDRPKLLKNYSTTIKNRKVKTDGNACSETLFQFR